MSEDRDEILANFQACTGLDDVAQAIYFLEESNWDLLGAVNRVIPQDQYNTANHSDVQIVDITKDEEAARPAETAVDMMSVGNNVGHNSVEQQPSTSNNKPRKRILLFSVHYNDRIIPLEIPDTGTVGEIKLMLHLETGIAPCQQLLSGWVRLPQSETAPLANLSLPRENILFMSTISNNDGVTAEEESNVSDRLSSIYTLKITDETSSKKYNLKYPGTRTILGVKTDVYALTDIPMRHQVWSGWPPSSDDHTMLALSGISYPAHELTVKKSPAATSNKDKRSMVVDLVDSDSSVEEFEDAAESFNVEDDMFIDNLGTKKMEPLIPDNVDDETIGCIHFSEQFTNRYGPIHPTFFTGTLDDAIKEACLKPAKDRKILALYLHHDASVLSNVFCTQLLGFESVMQMLENNFVLWGWDLTYESNKQRLQSSISRNLGSLAAMTVRNIPVDKLPAVIVIMKVRSSTEIYTVIYGNVSVNELLLRLVDAVDVWSGHQRVEVREEEERAARELVKWEQDQAYRESLELDRAKEEAKRQHELMETETRRRVETERAEVEAKKERRRLEVEANLPPEPVTASGDSITKIRIRCPKGENLERRFTVETPLKVLLDYLIVQGYPTQEYKVISSWPRRDLTALDSSKTLRELNLCPQETVILEER